MTPKMAVTWFPLSPHYQLPTINYQPSTLNSPLSTIDMFIETIIHDYWGGQPELLTILPRERVLTGPTTIPCLPCLVLQCGTFRTVFRTNRSQGWERGELTMEMLHESLDAAQILLERVDRHFDRLRLRSGDSETMLRLRRDEWKSVRHDPGRWGAVVVYTVDVYAG